MQKLVWKRESLVYLSEVDLSPLLPPCVNVWYYILGKKKFLIQLKHYLKFGKKKELILIN